MHGITQIFLCFGNDISIRLNITDNLLLGIYYFTIDQNIPYYIIFKVYYRSRNYKPITFLSAVIRYQTVLIDTP